ncbi:hypothetical protein BJ508DRAFT_334432 [Ascobolus immersus RN42]|uniref:Uncharacterized protein n=1 Tax=Ascobolus immersus RN42 TaxID=1160509 RepID=A0A3N4HG67_ASCIM|nr:hypothetical protein BJ508DRAFT_334432 [Ascobolus immersus RN42]
MFRRTLLRNRNPLLTHHLPLYSPQMRRISNGKCNAAKFWRNSDEYLWWVVSGAFMGWNFFCLHHGYPAWVSRTGGRARAWVIGAGRKALGGSEERVDDGNGKMV